MTVRVNIKDKYDVLICRGTKWGNPYTHIKNKPTLATYIVNNRKDAINSYKEYILNGDGKYLLNSLHELKDKRIACYCKLNESCHGDILIELIEGKQYHSIF